MQSTKQPKGVGTGELALIRQIRSRAVKPGGRQESVVLGIGDDCAILRPPAGHEIVVTTDFSLESRHFDRRLHPPTSVGHRCLARGLSDLAAMGARPLGAFLSLALPKGTQASRRGQAWVEGFFSGLLALGAQTRTPLAGGDTSAAPGDAVLADIVLVGTVPRGTALRRSGARAGDRLYVTGALGGAAAEFAHLQQKPATFRTAAAEGAHPHLFPQPRLRAGEALRSRKLAMAAMDISDGLSTDLHHLCEESGVGAVVDAAALPIHPFAGTLPDGGFEAALHGGEDYELLFAARPATVMPKRVSGVPVHCIGRFTRLREVLLEKDGKRVSLPAAGWEHSL